MWQSIYAERKLKNIIKIMNSFNAVDPGLYICQSISVKYCYGILQVHLRRMSNILSIELRHQFRYLVWMSRVENQYSSGADNNPSY